MSIAIGRDEWWRIHRALIRDGVETALIEKVQDIIEMGAQGSVRVPDAANDDLDESLDLLAAVVEDHQDSIEALFDVVKHHQSIIELHQAAAVRMNEQLTELVEWSEDADDAERIDANVSDLETRQHGLLSSLEGTDERVAELAKELAAERKARQALAKRVAAHVALPKHVAVVDDGS